MMTMERHDGKRAADKSSVLHLWSAIKGVSVSGSFKNKGGDGIKRSLPLLHESAGQKDKS